MPFPRCTLPPVLPVPTAGRGRSCTPRRPGRAFVSALLLTGVVTSVPAQTSVGITRSDLALRLGALAHDSMLGRDAGHIGNVRATDYVANELRRIGVRPAGEQEYMQTIPLVSRRPDPASTIQGGGRTLRLEADFALLRAGFGAEIYGGRAEGEVAVIFGGQLGAADAVAPEAVGGALVLFAPPIGGNGAPVMGPGPLVPHLSRYAAAAAVAVIAYDQASPGLRAFLGQPSLVLSPSPGHTPQVAALISVSGATALLGADPGTLRPGARGSAPARLALRYAESPTSAPARNVIGVIPGRDPGLRGQYVVLGAHTDHVGLTPAPIDHDSVRAYNTVIRPLGANNPPRQPTTEEASRIQALRDSLRRIRPPRADSIFNGADDDASGVSVLLELAEHFVANPPARSLLFVFHTAEERGLYGASWYSANPTVPRDSMAVVVNLDQVSRGGPNDMPNANANTLYALGTRRLSSEVGALVERVNTEGRHGFALDYTYDAPGHPANGYCRSDHYMYARFGIPIAFFSAGWHRDYHMVTDEVEYLSLDTMMRVTGFVRDLTTALASQPRRPVVDGQRPANPFGNCQQ